MSARAWAASALLRASGALGSAGPRLAALAARAAEVASDAAHLISPVKECPGCGAMVPALALVGVEVCGACAEREEEGPTVVPPDLRGLRWPVLRSDADPARGKLN